MAITNAASSTYQYPISSESIDTDRHHAILGLMRSRILLLLLTVVLVMSAGCRNRGLKVLSPQFAECWLASYLDDQQVGYAMYRYRRTTDGYTFESLMRMAVSMMGRSQRVKVWSRTFTNPDLTLRGFEFEMGSQDNSYRVTGEVRGNELLLTDQHGHLERRLALDGKVYPVEALGVLAVSSNMRPGTTRNLLVFDGTVVGVMPTQLTVVNWVRLPVAAETIPALQMRVNRAKLEFDIWVDSTGLSIREESPAGMSSVRTTPELAAAGELAGAQLDILEMFSIPTDTAVPVPPQVRRSVLEVTGIDNTLFELSGGSQTVSSQQPLRVEVCSELPTAAIELPIKDMDQYLQPTLSLSSDDPRIQSTARKVIGNERNALTAARLLLDWTHRSLRKRATASFPNAREVLEQMSGDCNEHATLYAALARSAGIPCRVAVGLVYMDRAFYYHAWDEVYLGRWVPVDPTFGEFPAGALRLRLATGEIGDQSEVLAAVRRIGIRIVEFQ